MASLAEAARKYSELGWALTPLDGKNPRGFGWQNTQPLDPISAAEIWKAHQGSNMGLVLGPSGVIDFELDSGDEDLFWELSYTVAPTPTFYTGRGKPHVLYKDPGGLSRRTRDGLELRAGPHQSVLPPSIHPETGKAYEWVNDPDFGVELQPPPQKLLDFFSESTRAKGDFSSWREALGRKLGEGEGRHASLISYLGIAVNQFQTPEQLVAAAIAYASVTQDPPYPDEVIEEQALDCWHRYREEPVLEEAAEYLHIERADTIRMKNVEFLWEPFIQKSALHLLVGRKGVGKGTMLAWLAAQVTLGNGFGPARQVLWVSGEDSFEIDVLPRFKAQNGDEKRLLAVRQKVIFPRDLASLRSVCEGEDVGLVIIDPIVSVMGGANANDEASIYAAIGPLNELSDKLDTAVIGVRHIGKNAEYDALESVLGSVAWVNIPRAVLNVSQTEQYIPMSGVSKTVTLNILASNRVRSGEPAFFSLNETTVKGVNKPVPMVVR